MAVSTLSPEAAFAQGIDDGHAAAQAADHGRRALADVAARTDDSDPASVARFWGFATGVSFVTESLNVVELVGVTS
jgi:hypothetical protein